MLAKIFDFSTMQCCILTALLFTLTLEKKEHFKIRILITIICCLLFIPIIYSIQTFEPHLIDRNIEVTIKSIICLCLYIGCSSLIFYFCCQTNKVNALYWGSLTYLTQDLAYTVFVLFFPYAAHRSTQLLLIDTLWIEIIIAIIVNLVIYFFLVKKINKQINSISHISRSLNYMLFILIVGRTMGTLAKLSLNNHTQSMLRFLILYDILLTTSLLTAQVLIFKEEKYQKELQLETYLRRQQYQQFYLFKETTASINHKYHDLKHIVQALQVDQSIDSKKALENIQESIHSFDSIQNTGNPTLDTLLSNTFEKCYQNKIEWTCTVDQKSLDFMNSFDLFVMLGNALDNAIESVLKIENIQKRFISIQIKRKSQMTIISIKNYCIQDFQFSNNSLVTSKQEKSEHGYGLKSIKSIVSKYNGHTKIKIEDSIFTLNILLPIEKK